MISPVSCIFHRQENTIYFILLCWFSWSFKLGIGFQDFWYFSIFSIKICKLLDDFRSRRTRPGNRKTDFSLPLIYFLRRLTKDCWLTTKRREKTAFIRAKNNATTTNNQLRSRHLKPTHIHKILFHSNISTHFKFCSF